MDDAQTLIATLQSAPRIVIGLIREVPPQYMKRRPSPTEWSVHEHACHISTADTAYLLRLELILSDPAPYIKSMLPSADEEAGSLLNNDLDEALALYERERVRLVERLTRIFHELEGFIGKAFKGAAVLRYRKPLITQHMEASGSPEG